MATKGKSWKHLTERDFKTMKTLQEAGLSISKTAAATGRSWGTVQTLYESDTFVEYRQRVSARKAKAEQSPVATPRPKQPDSLDELRLRTVIAQERQADALEALVKAWQSAPSKRKLF